MGLKSGERTLAQDKVYPLDVADRRFATPEEAAVVDFPPRYVRVDDVSYSQRGERAKVFLLTNEEPYLYPYHVYCERDRDRRWSETHSSN